MVLKYSCRVDAPEGLGLTVPVVRRPQVAPAKLILLSEMCSYDFKPKDSVICEEGSVSANVYATSLPISYLLLVHLNVWPVLS